MVNPMTAAEWDLQFARQAGWTRATRLHLYRRANLLRARRALDIGSGTGTVTEELAVATRGRVVGVDLDPAMVGFARQRRGRADYHLADAHRLPFRAGSFDITVCHFTLMWCRDPAQVAREMVRVTRPGGTLLVCAEPDYGGRIDHPMLPIGSWQIESLRREGADPCLGRRLRALFSMPGVHQAEVGVMAGVWDQATLRGEFEAEWALWEHSLSGWVAAGELAQCKAADWAATAAGERLVYVPMFYALVRLSAPS